MTDIDHIIEFGSDLANEFGFTLDKFHQASWLWRKDDVIWLSMIVTRRELRRQGHLTTLCQTILDKGYSVIIPTPLGHMKDFVKKHGYVQTEPEDSGHKIWLKEPAEKKVSS